jgi:hypothetical protein
VAAFGAAAGEDGAAILAFHARAEAVVFARLRLFG